MAMKCRACFAGCAEPAQEKQGRKLALRSPFQAAGVRSLSFRDVLLVAAGARRAPQCVIWWAGIRNGCSPGATMAGMATIPAGTIVVNLTGSFLIGLLAGFAESRALLGPDARLLLVTGVLGGYTTFSALSLETLLLLRAGQSGTALLSVGLQVVLGVALAYAGFMGAMAVGRPS